jgi:hypothetical protein
VVPRRVARRRWLSGLPARPPPQPPKEPCRERWSRPTQRAASGAPGAFSSSGNRITFTPRGEDRYPRLSPIRLMKLPYSPGRTGFWDRSWSRPRCGRRRPWPDGPCREYARFGNDPVVFVWQSTCPGTRPGLPSIHGQRDRSPSRGAPGRPGRRADPLHPRHDGAGGHLHHGARLGRHGHGLTALATAWIASQASPRGLVSGSGSSRGSSPSRSAAWPSRGSHAAPRPPCARPGPPLRSDAGAASWPAS